VLKNAVSACQVRGGEFLGVVPCRLLSRLVRVPTMTIVRRHWPRGLTPLGLITNEDGFSWGTQFAADTLPLPFGRGIALRIAGTHTYAAAIPVESEWETAVRAARLRHRLPDYLATFGAECRMIKAATCGPQSSSGHSPREFVRRYFADRMILRLSRC
jgi:hypothetical protein